MIRAVSLMGSVSRNAGGMFHSVRGLAKALNERDVKVTVLGSKDKFTSQDIGAWQPIRVVEYEPSWPRKFGYSRAVRRELCDLVPDLIHTHGLWQYSSCAVAAHHAKYKTPYLVSPHGMLDPWALKNSRWRKKVAYALYEGRHLRNAICLRALSESGADSIRKLGLKNPICVIPNGVVVPADDGTIPDAPWDHALAAGRKVLLFLGRIHPKKGLENLLRAWAELQRSNSTPDWTLAIAGWDQNAHESNLKKIANELDLPWIDLRTPSDGGPRTSAPVLFVGPQFGSGKFASLFHCDAFVLPSFSEGVPMAVLEAWAYRKPVAMTLECNIPNAFASGAAFQIQTDVALLANGLREFLNSPPAVLQEFGNKGAAKVKESFTWDRISEEMKSVYEWMLGGGPAPSLLRFD